VITKLHEFVNKTRVTSEEWMTAIDFLTRTGQTCIPLHQESILLSDMLGVSALVDALNNQLVSVVSVVTESSILGLFFTEDAPNGASYFHAESSIASEWKGEYLYIKGRVRTTSGMPIPGAVIKTLETDDKGFYDTQYTDRIVADCHGWLATNKDSKYGYLAIVPI
ncbi:Intradiol ring-cleavage dioxygenase, partial [Lactarius deliciosus]